MTNTEKQNVYGRITSTIIASLEQGVRPWMKPWNAEHAAGRITRPLRHNGQPYSGINILMLWASAVEQGFAAPIWMTFKQALELKASVRKGEKGTLVVYANSVTRTEHDDATGEDVAREIPFLKGYTVFNVEQIDGLPEIYYAKVQPRLTPVERIQRAEEFFAATKAVIRFGGNRAYYTAEADRIQIPAIEAFRDAESFYATLAHETTHWTKHPSRLQREFGRKGWGDEGYAREELVAELGAAFLCADLELTPEVRDDHASYIASWLDALRNDKRCIVQAAAYAQLRGHHPSHRRCTSGSFRRNCLWLYRCRSFRPAWANIHSVLHRSEDGVGILGLAQVSSAVCVLPCGCQCVHFRIRPAPDSLRRFAPAAVRRPDARVALFAFVVSAHRLHVGSPVDPVVGELALHGTVRGIRRSHKLVIVGEVRVSETRLMSSPSEEFNAAKRLYVEQFGAALVSNSYLKAGVLALAAVCLGLMFLTIRTYQALRQVKPLVVRIDEVGRAEAVTYNSFEYKPREAEIRYFLMDFVQRHYSRVRATVKENYARSLFYLDGRLADATIEENKKNRVIENFLVGQGDEIEVQVKNVAIEDLRVPPYKATVEFEKAYYTAADHLPTKRERYVAHFVFIVREHVPNSMIPINPLGLTITYFREDQAFE